MSEISEVPSGTAAVARRPAWYRRPVLILPLVLAVVAAAGLALVVVLSPHGITARGTIVDRLTGQPVAAARLAGDGKSATTNARGQFQIPGIAAGTRLRVQARYYAPARLTAAQAPVRVRLAPVPVPVTVTSALTGRPLPATLVLPGEDRAQARADGTATLYRIGPGQAVAVSAAGYRPAHVVVGPGHTVTAVLEPTLATMTAQLDAWDRGRRYQAMINWILRPATGYTFMGTSPHDWAKDNKQMAGDLLTAYIGGGYTADGLSATIQISWPGDRWDAAGMASIGPGPPMRPVTLAGQRAWNGGPDSQHVVTAVWSYGPALVTVTGTSDQYQADAMLTAIIKAMTSPSQGS